MFHLVASPVDKLKLAPQPFLVREHLHRAAAPQPWHHVERLQRALVAHPLVDQDGPHEIARRLENREMLRQVDVEDLPLARKEGERLDVRLVRGLFELVTVAGTVKFNDQTVRRSRSARVDWVRRGVRHVDDGPDTLALDVVALLKIHRHGQLAQLFRSDNRRKAKGCEDQKDACLSFHANSISYPRTTQHVTFRSSQAGRIGRGRRRSHSA